MFLNARPQAKLGALGDPDCCRNCARHLREGFAYCCLACKVRGGVGEAGPTIPSHPLQRAGETKLVRLFCIFLSHPRPLGSCAPGDVSSDSSFPSSPCSPQD